MSPVLAAAVWLALGLPVQAGQGAPRDQFLGHSPGQPLIDAAILPRPLDKTLLADLHGVQEGCAGPCAAPAQVSAYLDQIARACAGLGLSAGDLALAMEHYAPGGVPRMKPTAAAAPQAGKPGSLPGFKPALVKKRASEIAAALGRSPYVAAAGTLAATAPSERLAAPSAGPGSRTAPSGPPPPRPAPMEPSDVERALGRALLAEIAKRPAGRALLSSIAKVPDIVLEALDPDIFAQRSSRGAVETISIGTYRIADLLRALDPQGAARWGSLSEPVMLRRYLAAKPGMIAEVARHADTFCAHELAHSAQSRRRGGGLLRRTVEGWIDLINRGKYPIEREWEAFGAQNLYFHEKAKEDLSVLRFNAPFTSPALQYASYIKSLAGYRRLNAGLYRSDAARAEELRFRKAEGAYFKEALAREDRDWPLISAEGNILQARIHIIQGYPTLSLTYIQTAHERIVQNGLSMSLAKEAREVFKEALSGIEAGLAQAEAGRRPWFWRRGDIALMRLLGASLGVPLPGRAAAAVETK